MQKGSLGNPHTHALSFPPLHLKQSPNLTYLFSYSYSYTLLYLSPSFISLSIQTVPFTLSHSHFLPSMDPDALTATIFKWDPRTVLPPITRPSSLLLDFSAPPPDSAAAAVSVCPPTRGLEELFHAYGIRYLTVSKIAELGFTASTLVDMKDQELDDMMNSLSHIFRWDLLVGERYGIKAAVRAERRRLDDNDDVRRRSLVSTNALDALSQEGLSEEAGVMQQEKEVVGSTWEKRRRKRKMKKMKKRGGGDGNDDDDDADDDDDDEINGEEEKEYLEEGRSNNREVYCERQREHPFIVTEPGEVARGKKNGLDYLFHLYDQCRHFLIQVQTIAKNRGDKCPTKVTNQVFRYAKKAGASYINKPKMRHYVHCYALHCLDEQVSNELRRVFKERGENVGVWRQACYKPLVAIAAPQAWDIDAIFNAHPRLSIWYVPTKLRQLCHAARNAAAGGSGSGSGGQLPF